MNFSNLIALFCFLATSIGCSSDPGDKLVGKWYEVSADTAAIEYFKGGTVQLYGDISAAGNYSIISENRIRHDLSGIGSLAGPMIFTYAIADEELLLTDPRGKEYVYLRSEVGSRMRYEEQQRVELEIQLASIPKPLITMVDEAMALAKPAVESIDRFYNANGRLPHSGDKGWTSEIQQLTADKRIGVGGIGTQIVQVLFRQEYIRQFDGGLPGLHQAYLYVKYEPIKQEDGSLAWSCISGLQGNQKYVAALRGQCVRL